MPQFGQVNNSMVGLAQTVTLRQNVSHHGVAGADVDLKTRWPPPLPSMRWLPPICRHLGAALQDPSSRYSSGISAIEC